MNKLFNEMSSMKPWYRTEKSTFRIKNIQMKKRYFIHAVYLITLSWGKRPLKTVV